MKKKHFKITRKVKKVKHHTTITSQTTHLKYHKYVLIFFV